MRLNESFLEVNSNTLKRCRCQANHYYRPYGLRVFFRWLLIKWIRINYSWNITLLKSLNILYITIIHRNIKNNNNLMTYNQLQSHTYNVFVVFFFSINPQRSLQDCSPIRSSSGTCNKLSWIVSISTPPREALNKISSSTLKRFWVL